MQNPAASRLQAWAQKNEASALRTLNAFAVDLISIPSVEDLFWYVAQNVVGKLDFIDCVIYQADANQTELRQVAAWGEKNPYGRNIINPLVIPFGRGITGTVAETRQPMIVSDLQNDRSYIPDTQIARSEICVPLIVHDRLVGVIDSEHPDANAFGEAELEILSTVAAMVSGKLSLLEESRRSLERYRDLVASHVQLSHEVEARKALEAKLFEARKLEALGRLTGRLAHEFNNILTVILGNLELLEPELTAPPATGYLAEAKTSADRGARLMRDMLIFAQRTRLNPEVIDLNELVISFREAHALGMARGVDLELAHDLWPVSADWDAMENVLEKLVENAREACGSGGKIAIRTENRVHRMSDNALLSTEMPPGRYVRLSVTDTGAGIPADRISQIFDPFFTTKAVGSGTGLGLSIVRGFAQQSGGAVKVASTPGEGSVFDLFLPALDSAGNDSLTTIR